MLRAQLLIRDFVSTVHLSPVQVPIGIPRGDGGGGGRGDRFAVSLALTDDPSCVDTAGRGARFTDVGTSNRETTERPAF